MAAFEAMRTRIIVEMDLPADMKVTATVAVVMVGVPVPDIIILHLAPVDALASRVVPAATLRIAGRPMDR